MAQCHVDWCLLLSTKIQGSSLPIVFVNVLGKAEQGRLIKFRGNMN